jgi:hypothetical protein
MPGFGVIWPFATGLVKVGNPPISADLRSLRLGPVWGNEEPFKIGKAVGPPLGTIGRRAGHPLIGVAGSDR